MKKKILTVLVVILSVLALIAAGVIGFIWYRDNHIFVEGAVYPISATELDLREKDISVEHYDAVHSQLPDCVILWNVPFQDTKYPHDTVTIAITQLDEADIERLAYFEQLKTVNASDCTDYAILEVLQACYPELEVVYTVSLGKMSVEPGVTELVLNVGDYDYDTLMNNLVYLQDLKSVTLRMPELTLEQVEALRSTYEEITFTCTVEILGVEYDAETTELDLSGITSEQLPQVLEKLPMLTKLESIELVNAEGVSILTMEDVKLLKETAPEISVHYVFDFFGVTVSTTDTEVMVKNKKIGDDNEPAVRLALDIMENCERFVLDNCRMSDEVMAKIREDYRGRVKVVWRVWFGQNGSSLTDAQIIRAVYGLVDDNCHDLVYCEDVKYMDLGHNEFLDNCDFVAGMPNLEYVILSGAPIKSLDGFANCKKLKFLEIAFCEYITDVSPLANCENLQMLNISNTHVTDLSPLDNLPLTHLCVRNNPSGRCRLSQEEQDRVIAQHPNCWISFSGPQPYGVGWRYGENELEPLDHYKLIRKVFRLDLDPNIPNNVGWYLKDEETTYKES